MSHTSQYFEFFYPKSTKIDDQLYNDPFWIILYTYLLTHTNTHKYIQTHMNVVNNTSIILGCTHLITPGEITNLLIHKHKQIN